jgi:hypothetical protein
MPDHPSDPPPSTPLDTVSPAFPILLCYLLCPSGQGARARKRGRKRERREGGRDGNIERERERDDAHIQRNKEMNAREERKLKRRGGGQEDGESCHLSLVTCQKTQGIQR